MKIDWKKVSKSPGYIHIKRKYIDDVNKGTSSRSKEELYKHFKWIISRAKHYAHVKHTTIDRILMEWAFDKNNQYWWLNAYQDCKQSRFDTTPYIPRKRKDPHKVNKKERWSNEEKKRAKRRKELNLKYKP